MDHYEELGLLRSASPEEIRQAYRRVARLLHPDRCTDDDTRRLADLQMKRLNGILAVLTDAASRAAYNQRLLPRTEPPPPVPQSLLRPWGWPVAAAILLCSLLWLLPKRAASPAALHATTPAVPATTPAPERPARSRHISIPSAKRPVPPPSLEPVDSASAPLLPEVPAPLTEELRMTLPVLPELPLSAPPPPAQDSLAGDWLYVPVTHVKDAALYPPEYIELRVKEDAGAISGRYQARYRVPDQAISPNVVFRFRGWTGAEGGSLSWTGSGGAHGQLTLRLLANGALEVTWLADHLGTELGLVSGTATLVRKQE